MDNTAKPAFLYRHGFTVLLAVALLLPLSINHYPLIFSDTGTYIGAIRQHSVPVDRPVFYSIYIYLSSFFGKTLYLTVALQAICCAFIIRSVLNLICSEKNNKIISLLFCLLLPLSFLAVEICTVMPDAWAEIGLLSLLLLLLDSKPNKLVLLTFICFAVLFAPANGIIFFGVTLAYAFIFLLIHKKISVVKRPFLALVFIVASIWANSSVNYIAHGRFTPIAAAPAFMFANLNQKKLLDPGIERYCPSYKETLICKEYPSYRGIPSDQLLWGKAGRDIGVFDIKNQKLFDRINKFSMRKNDTAFIADTVKIVRQSLFSMPDDINTLYGEAYPSNSSVYQMVQKYYNLAAFTRSVQEKGQSAFSYLRGYQFLTIFGLLLSSLLILLSIKRMTPTKWLLLAGSVIYLVFNNLILCGLSEPVTRYTIHGCNICLILFVAVAASLVVDQHHGQDKSAEEG